MAERGDERSAARRRRGLRGMALGVVVLFFVLGWSDRSRTGEFALGDIRRVVVVTDAGPIEVRTGSVNRVRHADTWLLRGPEVESILDQDEAVIRVRCRTSFPCRSSVWIETVPGVELVVISADDVVTAPTFDGALTVFSGDSDVALGPIKGSARVVTGRGDVSADGLELAELTVEVDRSRIDVEFAASPASVVLTSARGPVRLAVPDTGYQISIRAAEERTDEVDVQVASVEESESQIAILSEGTVEVVAFEE